MITTTTTELTTTPPVGSNIAVPFPYRFDEEEHITVYRVTSAGARYLLTEGTDYTVTGAGDSAGGLITFTVVDTGDTFTITRVVDITQQLDYVEQDRFPAQSHEKQLDKQIMVDQQLDAGLTRSIKVHPGEPTPTVSARASRKDKLLGFDSNGDFAELSPQRVLDLLPLPPGSVGGLGTKVFTDDADRAIAVPDFVGQIGVQTDTGVSYSASGTLAGQWVQYNPGPKTRLVVNDTTLSNAISDATVTTIQVLGTLTLDTDHIGANAIPHNKSIRFVEGSSINFNAQRLEINGPVIAPEHLTIFSNYVKTKATISVFGSFGGVDRHMGWWTDPYPTVTDHTTALQAAVYSFQITSTNMGNYSILNEWRANDATNNVAFYRGTLRLFSGGMVCTAAIDMQNFAIIIRGVGEQASMIRWEDLGTAVSVSVNATTDVFTSAGHGFVNGDRVQVRATTMPTGLKASGGKAEKTWQIINADTNTFQLSDVAHVEPRWADPTQVNVGADRIDVTAHGLVGNQKVRLHNIGGALPGGLSPHQDYYVIATSVDQYQLSASAGPGAAVTISSAGTGIHYIVTDTPVVTKTTGTAVTVAKCEQTGYTSCLLCTSAVNGLELRDLHLSVGQSLSPNAIVWDSTINAGFLEHSRVEGCSVTMEYGCRLFVPSSTNGNHMTFSRCSIVYEEVWTEPLVVGQITSEDVPTSTVNISGALAGVGIENYLPRIGGHHYMQFFSDAGRTTKTTRYGIRHLESSGNTVKLMTEAGLDATLPGTLSTQYFEIYTIQYGGLRELTTAQRSAFHFSGADAKISCDYCTIIAGAAIVFVTGNGQTSWFCSRNNHYETVHRAFRLEGSGRFSLSIDGDRLSDLFYTDKCVVWNNATGSNVIDASVSSWRNANANHINLIFDAVAISKTSGVTRQQSLGPEGLLNSAKISPSVGGNDQATYRRSHLGYHVFHNTPDYDINYATATPSEVATFLGIDTFFRADRAQSVRSFVDGDVTASQINVTTHGLVDLEKVRVHNEGGALPTDLAVDTDYWIIYVDANNYKLASSLENAIADRNLTLTAAGGGTHYVMADGHELVGWDDAVASNMTFISQNNPTYAVSGINGHPAVYFNGTNDWMRRTATGSYPLPNAQGGFMAVYQTDGDPGGGNRRILHSNLGSQFSLYHWGAGAEIRIQNTGSTGLVLKGNLMSNPNLRSVPLGVVAAWSPNQTEGYARGFYHKKTSNPVPAYYTMQAATGTFGLGSQTGSGTEFWLGWISDFGWWVNKPTRQQMDRAAGYIRWKYGAALLGE